MQLKGVKFDINIGEIERGRQNTELKEIKSFMYFVVLTRDVCNEEKEINEKTTKRLNKITKRCTGRL